MNERHESIRAGVAGRPRTGMRLGLVINGVAGAAVLALLSGPAAGARAADLTAGTATRVGMRATSVATLAASAVSLWSSGTLPPAAGASPVRRIATTAPSRTLAPLSTPAVAPHPRNRLIDPGLDVGVSTYSDCSGRTPLPRTTVAIDVCMTRDTYFVGHSFGGPFTGLIDAVNGETLTWYNAAGEAHRYTIRGRQYTHAYGPADIPPQGTAAQFQTCLTPGGSRIVTYFAASR
jgi:hypothetical protein